MASSVTNNVPWNSQPLDVWAQKHAAGTFIDLDNRRTHYLDKGIGNPVLLVHGFLYDSFTWHNNIDALSAAFRVIAPDLWGFGYSTREPLDYGYPLYARQLLFLLDALQIDKASIVGHSMGGGTAIYFAVRHPDPHHLGRARQSHSASPWSRDAQAARGITPGDF